MKSAISSLGLASVGAALLFAPSAHAIDVTIDSGATWLSFVNAFQTPANGGGYAFGFGYNFTLNTASFSGDNLVLGATQINNAVDNEWWVGGVGGPGAVANKITHTSSYVEPSSNDFNGTSVTFSGSVLSNTLVSGYSVSAFIMDFAPDFSSNVAQMLPLSTGDFTLTLDTINDPARHVQYGFIMVGPNVWVTDVASKGNVVIAPTSAAVIPEPSSFALIGALVAGAVAMGGRRRR